MRQYLFGIVIGCVHVCVRVYCGMQCGMCCACVASIYMSKPLSLLRGLLLKQSQRESPRVCEMTQTETIQLAPDTPGKDVCQRSVFPTSPLVWGEPFRTQKLLHVGLMNRDTPAAVGWARVQAARRLSEPKRHAAFGQILRSTILWMDEIHFAPPFRNPSF